MTRAQINEKLIPIFREILGNKELVLVESLSANDVDNWDSLSHMLLVAEIEKQFSINFKLKELNKMKNIGDLTDIIASKFE